MRWLRRLDQQQRVGALIVAIMSVFVIVFAISARGGGDDPPAVTGSTGTTPARSTTTTTTTTDAPTTSASTSTTTATTAPSTSSSTSSTTSTTTTTEPRLETLALGAQGDEVIELQQTLNAVMGSALLADGDYGAATQRVVTEFQVSVGLPANGEADHDTRILLGELAAGEIQALRTWPLPDVGDGGADGCQVVVIGDSLMAGAGAFHERLLAEIPCASAVDGVGGRTLLYGWQCRVVPVGGGTSALTLLDDPAPGNESCAPAGLELLRTWSEANALGDIVVIALGTNDAGLFTPEGWAAHWQTALDLSGERPVVFVTTKARPGSAREATQEEYSQALREWCRERIRCVIADWAITETANDPSVYFDAVHLRTPGSVARAEFIRDMVRLLLDDNLNPQPGGLPTTTTTTTSTTTTAPTTTTTTSTTTTTVPPTTTTTSTTSTTSTSTTSSTTSTTVVT